MDVAWFLGLPEGTGELLDSAEGTTIGRNIDGADCEGDPEGTFCLWDRIAVSTADDEIRSVTIVDALPNFIAFDDLELCLGEGLCVRDPEWQCDGDVDGDGQVNPVDSGLIQAAYESTEEVV